MSITNRIIFALDAYLLLFILVGMSLTEFAPAEVRPLLLIAAAVMAAVPFVMAAEGLRSHG